MERRRLAGMKPASLSHYRKIKKFKKFLKLVYLFLRLTRPIRRRKKAEIGDRISKCYDQHTTQF